MKISRLAKRSAPSLLKRVGYEMGKFNMHDKILILDFGSQYSQLIARRVREIGAYCELWPADIDEQAIKNFNPKGIILSGGHESVTQADTIRAPKIVFDLGIPVLGICYGMQTMAEQLGGKVENAHSSEFGFVRTKIMTKSALFAGIAENDLEVWMSHGDQVEKLPSNFKTICSTSTCEHAGISDEARHFYGLQFHPEVTHTKKGLQILTNFIRDICGCVCDWNSEHISEEKIAEIRKQVGKEKVLLGLSGGVDSSVAAALLHKAIGDQLICVFVDTGLLRLNEVQEVETVFAKNLGVELITVDAKAQFYQALKGVEEPEAKRKIVGQEFINVFQAQARKLNDVKFLAQGTIYPDIIESAKTKTGKGQVIKSHHNVGGLPADLKFELVEPLRELFKDEVRKLGLSLGLPETLVFRHPFPGPGLAVRIIGEIKAENVEILQRADAIFIEALRRHKLYETVSQAFAVFLPIKSVGVKGDARHYGYVLALRAVKTTDFMTAEWADLPHAFLAEVSLQIVNELKEVSRVVYDITGKPPGTIEWE